MLFFVQSVYTFFYKSPCTLYCNVYFFHFWKVLKLPYFLKNVILYLCSKNTFIRPCIKILNLPGIGMYISFHMFTLPSFCTFLHIFAAPIPHTAHLQHTKQHSEMPQHFGNKMIQSIETISNHTGHNCQCYDQRGVNKF